MSAFVGRVEPMARLTSAFQVLTVPPAGTTARWPGLVLITGEAGIGKTALLERFATEVAAKGAAVGWGSCWDGEQAPAWWPWTQALRGLLEQSAGLRNAARPELAAVLPDLASATLPVTGTDAADRVRVFDAVGQLLARAVLQGPVLVIIDDLQWADISTVDLLRFLAHQIQSGALMLVCAYRPHEPHPKIAAGLADLVTAAELVLLHGLTRTELEDLVRAVAGGKAPTEWAELIHQRTGGHPLFARELCRLLAAGGVATETPAAVREVIVGRLARLSTSCAAMLNAAAVAGSALLTDVLAEVTGESPTTVLELIGEASAAGILVPTGDGAGVAQFSHDLYRETIYDLLPPGRRLALHHRLAIALHARHERGGQVLPVELARHFAAAISLAGVTPAVEWARAAADADTARFASADAADHLARVRSAAADAGHRLPDVDLVGLLTAEAGLRLRSGDVTAARELLNNAWTRAVVSVEAELLGTVALGLDALGARFAMPRADLVAALETARQALEGNASVLEAQITAALARQLQHSVPADRPRAAPLAEQAVTIARTLDDPATLASCLLAQHDTRWTPGTATERAAIAAEITELARRANDPERQAQGLLLTASAQLEGGRSTFRATLTVYQHVTQALRQPRHDYLLRIRQAALALIDGDIDGGDQLSAEAADLGHAIDDSDTGNVRMSQRLEIVRARNQPDELHATAADAVRWWVGAPAHAHAVAAGFLARAGDQDAARRELDTVLSLDWRADRSYLWSIFVGEMTAAAIALGDQQLCRQLLDDLGPVADTCAVNGALVCFMGAHAHRVGLLYAALGQPRLARPWLAKALQIHRRLGARAWEIESCVELARLGGDDAERHAQRASALRGGLRLGADVPSSQSGMPRLLRVGDMWQASYRGQSAYLRDMKGLHDLAALLAHPGVHLSSVELAGVRMSPAGADATLDRTALMSYRKRLADLDEELTVAQNRSDLAAQGRVAGEREQLLAELRRATRPGGQPRPLGATTAERARKAVTARIRDAIGRISEALPELGTHLDRTVRTGITCRHDPGPS